MVTRREFVAQFGGVAVAAALGRSVWPPREQAADYTLRIGSHQLELTPRKAIRTTAYNNSVPGPVLRVREGARVSIDVVNNTRTDEMVHWHGLHVPPDVDGAHEQGTPHVPRGGTKRFEFIARPGGTRWYHTHGYAGHDLQRATYSGQFGFLIVDPSNDPARYDQEVLLALHDWDPYISGGDDAFQMVMYNISSINGRLLGFDQPIRVREGTRVLFRLLNASASMTHWLSLPGHRFRITALDGNAVPAPQSVETLRIAPGERVDAIVEMSAPGVWILGEPRDAVRNAGLGVVVEYANRSGAPQWTAPAAMAWDYTMFANRGTSANERTVEVQHIPMAFKAEFHGHGDFEHWSINGRTYPDNEVARLVQGRRYRLAFENPSLDPHPIHLHRHTFELTSIDGRPTSGLRKDVMLVPARGVAEIEFTADNPGATLFHCHQQEHMDSGFKLLLRYA